MAKQHDKQFKLDVLKKQSTFWKMTEAIYLEVTEKTEAAKRLDTQVSVSEC